jgi:hypothetical protein
LRVALGHHDREAAQKVRRTPSPRREGGRHE